MRRHRSGLRWTLGLCSILVLGWALPGIARAQQRDPLAIARDDLRASSATLRLELGDVERAELSRRRRNPRTGAHHFFFRQELHGLPVIGGDLGVSIDARGRVLSRWSRAVSRLDRAAPAPLPRLSAEQAVARAAAHLALAADAYTMDTPAQLTYLARRPDRAALIWDVVLRTRDSRFWGDVFVDAASGAVLEVHNWIDRDSYRVFALPVEHPEQGARTLVTNPADPTASPFGWHDSNGVAGAEFNDTRGNNALAQEDADANDTGGFRPSSGTRDFDFPLDLDQVPANYQSAAITNLFYWNNVAHDVFYQFGFDEAAGNFQTNNYGNGGIGNDAVRADAQDGSDVNNADFATPPDGTAPRMQMFVFTLGSARVNVNAPAGIAGPRPAGVAAFGPALGAVGVTGTVVQALDPATGTLPSPTDGCSALTNPGDVAGRIAIVDRGECNFTVKVKNCQDAGAIAVIVVNNAGDGLVTMSGSDPAIAIPSLFVGQSDGEEIEGELASGVNATLQVLVNRDADLDTGVVMHEYGHGVTNRLTGGPANVLCLDGSQGSGLGEGWSDFFALAFTALPGDAGPDPRGIGSYLSGTPGGIRSAPYSTDLVVNPFTFEDIETKTIPHGVGEVWAVTLWEAYWKLVTAYGFDPDLYAGDAGNQRALGLVIDALSIQPCDPSFLDARNALLSADVAANDGADECLLWDAFARRGMGENASDQGGPGIAVTEDFSVPAHCVDYCGDGVVSAPESCDDGNRIDFDGCHSVCLPESTFTLNGTAQGGSVTVTVQGVAVTLSTSAGQSAADVLAALAAAIDANPTLSAQGISARAQLGVLTTGGSITDSSIDDPGFAEQEIPALPLAGWVLALILVSAAAWPRSRRGR